MTTPIEITKALFERAGRCESQDELYEFVEAVLTSRGYHDKGLSWQEQADEILNDGADDDDLARFLEYGETLWFRLR